MDYNVSEVVRELLKIAGPVELLKSHPSRSVGGYPAYLPRPCAGTTRIKLWKLLPAASA